MVLLACTAWLLEGRVVGCWREREGGRERERERAREGERRESART
jgi:hypothetical protein